MDNYEDNFAQLMRAGAFALVYSTEENTLRAMCKLVDSEGEAYLLMRAAKLYLQWRTEGDE